MQTIQVGTKVKYRSASGRVRSATVTAVTSQTVLDLRIGRGATAAVITGASKVSPHAATAGWFQGGR